MSITNGMDKVSRFASSYVSDHVSEQRVGCDIEWHAKTHVRTSLVHLARHFIFFCIHVELTEHVTRWQSHFGEVRRVPGGHDNASIFGVVLDLFDALRELIHSLASVIGVHVDVLSAEMTPLEAVDWSEVPHFSVL